MSGVCKSVEVIPENKEFQKPGVCQGVEVVPEEAEFQKLFIKLASLKKSENKKLQDIAHCAVQ